MLYVTALLAATRGLLTILHAHLIADFIQSKPPGRKMVYENFNFKNRMYSLLKVTSDINVYASVFSDFGKYSID